MNFYGYVYRTVNEINFCMYIGKHKGQFNPKYLGSGKIIRRAVHKYGSKNFTVKVIGYAATLKDLNILEKKLIARHREFFKSKYIYNIADGGEGNPRKIGSKLSAESRKKISDSKIGKPRSEETKEKLRIASTGFKKSKETIEKHRAKMLGKKHTLETKAKISWANSHPSDETRKKKSEASRGRIFSAETRAKMSLTKLGRKNSLESKMKTSLSMRGRKKSPEHLQKLRKDRALQMIDGREEQRVAKFCLTIAKKKAAKILDTHPHNVADSSLLVVDQILVSNTDLKSIGILK